MSFMYRLSDRRGFTLTELIVVMAIFMSVLIITATAFNSILGQSGRQMKSVETQIEGIVGLELMRSDLQEAGYGLPWQYQSAIAFTSPECSSSAIHGFDPSGFDDAPSGVPRAVQGMDGDASHGYNESDYLVVKSTVSGLNPTAKKWTYLSYSSTGSRGKVWTEGNNFVNNEWGIVVRTSFLNGVLSKRLVVDASSAGIFTTQVSVSGGVLTVPSGFSPTSSTDTFIVYGIDDNDQPRMPFNRTDYYIDRPSPMPSSCAPHTGVLYKGVISQHDGSRTGYPLLDCVADFQVVYSLDTTGDGQVNLHDNAGLTALGTPPPADLIRNMVKEIRIYILAQEGKKDTGFTYPSVTVPVGETLNGVFYGRNFNLSDHIGTDWDHYRWKVYTIVAHPKSLN